MQRFLCDCGNALFFDNWLCLKCGSEVGYDPWVRQMAALRPGSGLRRCSNGARYGVCNWLVPEQGALDLCLSCRLNRTIPDLSLDLNRMLWGRMESAKRRLINTFLGLGIALPTKAEDFAHGVAFDIVSARFDPTVTMGHLNGIITMNLDEADDVFRHINREQLNERSRTLLGHFRHESGHYVWERWQNPLPPDSPERAAFRQLFGDERQNYAVALQNHYQQGPPADWGNSYISAYAASHPWEDWAETWGQYLQLLEGLETFTELGLETAKATLVSDPLPPEAGRLPPMLPQSDAEDAEFLDWLQRWVVLSMALNEMSLSLGQPMLYPFVLSIRVAQKLRLARWAAGQLKRDTSCYLPRRP
jgi:hypothetical protein